MAALMSKFESIGDNCEFGFIQRFHFHEEGGLLRWALLDIDALLMGLQNRFEGVYAFENLVPTGGGTMVFDQLTKIAFHTHMTATEQAGTWVFDHDEVERRAIHQDELRKIEYLRSKFWNTLAAGKKVVVFKNNNAIPTELALRLHTEIQRFGSCPLLYVDPQQPGERAGTVTCVAEGLYRGVIDWFAPYDKANETSQACWEEICQNTLILHTGQSLEPNSKS